MSPRLLAQLVAVVEAIVDERVEAKLAERGLTGDAGDVYTSSGLPAGVNGRTFARWCRIGRVTGAERDGAGWRCTAAAWREARSAGPSRRGLAPRSEGNVVTMLEAAGLRATRGRAAR